MNEDCNRNIASVSAIKGTQRCMIVLDNEDFFQCSKDLVLKYSLSQGTPLENGLQKKILDEQRIYDVKQAAYNYASYKPRTVKQVVTKLKQKDFTKEEIDTAIAFLTEFNLLDDNKYAQFFVVEYIKRKPAGKQLILEELLKRGIPKDIANITIKGYFPEEDSIALATKAAEKKMRLLNGKPPEKQKNSLISYLQRQGFEWDIIKVIIEKYFPRDSRTYF